MDNHNKHNVKRLLIAVAMLVIASPMVAAAELGMNYYHESMMGSWGGQYIPRTDSEINNDLDDIKSVTRYIKLYANPMVDGNVEHALGIADKARSKGMHVTLSMNTEDRELNDGNYGDYRNRVLDACQAANGRVDEFIVGNEVGLHSPWDTWGIRDRMESLINDCSFNGHTTYEAFFWDRDAWKTYDGRIHLNMYEHYDLFAQNVDELHQWKVTPHIGEWGDNFGSEQDQAEQIRKRWDKIQTAPVDLAYVFTYKEPSPSGTFGMLRNDGTKKPAWYALPTSGEQTTESSSTDTSTTESSTSTSDWSIGQLRASMTADGGSWEKQDTVMGDCRVMEYGTSAGDAKVLACKKGDAVEMYTQSSPSTSWKLTLDGGSVGSHTGFARFVPSTEGETSEPSTDSSTSTTTTTTTTSDADIASLNVGFESAAGGWKVEDSTSGDCRTIRYGTDAGEVKVLACEKGSDVEMYRQSEPSVSWKLTLGGGSVGSHSGFDRFTPAGTTSETTTQTSSQSEPTTETTTTQSANGWSATPNGQLAKHEDQGSCELAAFNTDAGYIEALACDKGGAWEMYLKSDANGATISYNGGSVGSHSGFDRW